LRQPPQESYSRAVEFWPLVGWLTGGVMAATLYLASYVVPYHIAVLLAIIVRLLITGAMHEDGLADFLDGFGGGGTDRERILAIMKDSHIGTYGVLGLTLYLAMLFAVLVAMPADLAALAVVAADPYAKMVASQIIVMMPYARTAATAKNRTVYQRPTTAAGVGLAVQGLLPMTVVLWLLRDVVSWSVVIFAPCFVFYFLYLLIWRRLHGYTGDCCGAVCLLTELATLLCFLVNI
jgi:adenosylcobinamide-GDP ribazoletransferase